MSANVHQQSVRRAFGVRTARRHADVRRRHDPPGRGWHAVRHHAQEERQVLLRQLAERQRTKATRQVGGGEMVSIAVQTAVVDVLASGEFCNARRRIAHLLTMYGFRDLCRHHRRSWSSPIRRPPRLRPPCLPALWYIGALMVCLGGYWFWFFIRVDVAAEGNSPFRFVRADLFVVSLVASVTLRPDMGVRCRRRATRPGQTCSWLCISSPRRCYLDQFRGPSSLTCSSSPLRPSRNEWPRRTARGATCRLPPTRPKVSAALAEQPQHY